MFTNDKQSINVDRAGFITYFNILRAPSFLLFISNDHEMFISTDFKVVEEMSLTLRKRRKASASNHIFEVAKQYDFR